MEQMFHSCATEARTMSPETSWDRLATALNRFGVIHIAPARPVTANGPETGRELFSDLFQAEDPRLHQATMFLLLTHPTLSVEAREAIDALAGDGRDRARRRYVAAASMQRMARTRIASRLGEQQLIPEAYLTELDLPSLSQDYGKESLWVLSQQEEARYGYNAWQSYRSLLDLFLNEIQRKDWGVACVNAPIENA